MGGFLLRTEKEIREKIKNVEKDKQNFAENLQDNGLLQAEEAMVFEHYNGYIEALLWLITKEE